MPSAVDRRIAGRIVAMPVVVGPVVVVTSGIVGAVQARIGAGGLLLIARPAVAALRELALDGRMRVAHRALACRTTRHRRLAAVTQSEKSTFTLTTAHAAL